MSDPAGYNFGGSDEGSHYIATRQGFGEDSLETKAYKEADSMNFNDLLRAIQADINNMNDKLCSLTDERYVHELTTRAVVRIKVAIERSV